MPHLLGGPAHRGTVHGLWAICMQRLPKGFSHVEDIPGVHTGSTAVVTSREDEKI